jgi:hypothetical protein
MGGIILFDDYSFKETIKGTDKFISEKKDNIEIIYKNNHQMAIKIKKS